MGSATRGSLETLRGSLQAVTDAQAVEQLLEVSAVLSDNRQLAQILADNAVPAAEKAQLQAQVFKGLLPEVAAVLTRAGELAWSSIDDFIEGVRTMGVRAGAKLDSNLDEELLQVARVISSSHELELTLADKLSEASYKLNAFEAVFAGKISRVAQAIAANLIAYPRGHRVAQLLREAANTAADEHGNLLAIVTVAAPLDGIREARLRQALTSRFGRPVKISTEINPELLGSVRVQVGDLVIDDSVRRRLEDLKLKLAA